MTRKKLWRTIAQKENAEAAAAARSDFIASASHEIRTPLHHLQGTRAFLHTYKPSWNLGRCVGGRLLTVRLAGYSDLLSRTELTEEGRILLYAIQHATKTLSLSAFEATLLLSSHTNHLDSHEQRTRLVKIGKGC